MAQSETKPRTVRLMTALLLVATFAAGAAAGAGLSRLSFRCHGPPHPRMFAPEHFEQLGLSPDQQQKAHQIAERHRPELEAILRETFPKVRAINEQMEQELREQLTPEQRAKLDQLKAQRPPMPPGSPFRGGHPPWPPPGHGPMGGPPGPHGPMGMPPGPPPDAPP